MLESVVARLKLRMGGMKCVGLRSEADRALVDAVVQEAQQQGATVSQKHLKGNLCSVLLTLKMTLNFCEFSHTTGQLQVFLLKLMNIHVMFKF